VPSHVNPHDPRFELDRQDNLVLLALGEPVPAEFQAHQAACEQCQRELAGFGQTVRLARESVEHRAQLDAEPPPSVWSEITAELGMTRPSTLTKPAPPHARSPRWRYALAAAAAVLIAGAGVTGGYLAGRSDGAPQAVIVSPAQLAPMPDGPPNVAGTATVHASTTGKQLTVITNGLPLRQGYYEVWLYNPTANNMVPIGALSEGGKGTFTLPGGIDLSAYHVVDVSAQDYTGGSVITHRQSVLQGHFSQ
jgi:anti-sigma-K factor RskA